MAVDDNLVLCYNRGCGQSFNPKENTSESCKHHPGTPVFHDAYKGWSCCNKKCTDFTEFLNIKGCSAGYHSNVKPVEPEKPKEPALGKDEVIEVRAPLPPQPKERPPFDSPMSDLKSDVSQSLKDALSKSVKAPVKETVQTDISESNEIPIGTSCKNNACKTTYSGTENSECVHHPGVPVFHEGLKFWSCCQKKTTEFSVFLQQPGCKTGSHCWIKNKNEDAEGNRTADCRLDWHQTGSYVYVTIYAKKCDPSQSSVKANPVRLTLNIHLPDQDADYSNDIHLAGVIDVNKSTVSYFPAKVEVQLFKADIGTWARLELTPATQQTKPKPATTIESTQEIEDRVESVDLSCI